jgi:LemA protein
VDKDVELSLIIIILISGVILLGVIYIINIYNKILNARNKVDNKFSQIDVQINKKIELISKLIDVIKDKVEQEDDVFFAAMDLSKMTLSGMDINAKIDFNIKISDILSKLFDNYANVKKNKKIISLKNDLSDIDSKINYAGEFYNDTVKVFNEMISDFPFSVVAKTFKFNKYDSL